MDPSVSKLEWFVRLNEAGRKALVGVGWGWRLVDGRMDFPRESEDFA